LLTRIAATVGLEADIRASGTKLDAPVQNKTAEKNELFPAVSNVGFGFTVSRFGGKLNARTQEDT